MSIAIPAANDNYLSLDATATKQLESGKLLTAVTSAPPGVEVQALVRCSPEHMLSLLTDYRAMPQRIFGLERAEVLQSSGETSTVRFTMKLPFPVGRLVWTNSIQTRSAGGIHSLEWTLLDG